MKYYKSYFFPGLCVKALTEIYEDREIEFTEETITICFNYTTNQYEAIFKGEFSSLLREPYKELYSQFFKPKYVMGERDEFHKHMDIFLNKVMNLISFI